MPNHQHEIFNYYNSAIGDLRSYIHKFALSGLAPKKNRVVNAFGVSIDPKFFPGILDDLVGVEPLPIPSNWHADIAEFGAALYAVDQAKDKFTVVELGCGWGCWLNITGVVAKRIGLDVRLIGVEGDEGHVKFAHESLVENGFHSSEYVIHTGIAHAEDGIALFPVQEKAGKNWGEAPLFNVNQKTAKRLIDAGSHQQLRQVPLKTLLPRDREKIDLLHIDIQGGEIQLVPDSLSFLTDKVVMLLIGTHSREIEGELFKALSDAGWKLDIERPAILGLAPNIHTLVDGVQLWRNPKFVPHAGGEDIIVPMEGCVELLNHPEKVVCNEDFSLSVTVTNSSSKIWSSKGMFPVSLSYHWEGVSTGHSVFDGIRTPFDGGQLASQNKNTQIMNVKAPAIPGKWKCQVTLVQDGVRWFEGAGFQSFEIIIDVE